MSFSNGINNALQKLEIAVASETAGECKPNFLDSTSGDLNDSPIYLENDKTLLYQMVNNVINCKFDVSLSVKPSELFHKVYVTDENCTSAIETLKKNIKDYITDTSASVCIRQMNILFLGISSLQQFVILNWTGPTQSTTADMHFLIDCLGETDDSKKTISAMLSADGDYIYSNTKYPQLLLLSKILLSALEDGLCITKSWWILRCLMIHQQILPERNLELNQRMKSCIKDVLSMSWIEENENLAAKVQFLVECGHMHLFYHEIVPAKQYFTDAQSIVGIKMELSGAFGKRTYFQQKAIAQLYLKLTRNGDYQSKVKYAFDSSAFPCDLHLQDDTLLNRVKFINDSETVIEDLCPEEQIVLLAHCCLLQRSGASEKLLQEELMAYIDYLLSQPKVWCVYFKSLIMRCELERSSSRRIERSMMQIEALVDAINKGNSSASARLPMFYAARFPPQWKLEKELADLLLSLGATKSALEIYQRLELWEDIVICYQRLNRNDKAAVIVKQLIEENETPALWCLLGDVTDDPQCYEKAWEISGKRNCRAVRSLGFYYYQRNKFETCISFFRTSLEINHLQPTVWFALGFAATQTENYELAAHSYRSVVDLDSDNFEAWNNLSNAYIKTRQKVRAWKSLQEALKCSYDNWKVWENFILVSIDVGAFEDAINAYHRLLDIKGKHHDEEILEIIVKAIVRDLPDMTGQPSSRLKSKALKLFGRVTSVITNSSRIWKCYASLHSSSAEWSSSPECTERVLQYLTKAHRCNVQQPRWEKDSSACKVVAEDAIALSDVYSAHIIVCDENIKVQKKSSARLMLRSVISRIEQQLQDFEQHQVEELMPLLEQLQEKMDNVANL